MRMTNRVTIAAACLAGLMAAPAAHAQTVPTEPDAQTTTDKHEVRPTSFGYARLGYGGVFGDRNYGNPTIGFGYRTEVKSIGLDVSFLNFQMPSGSDSDYGSSQSSFAGSLLKLEGLYYMKPEANATPYVGGGFSYGFTGFSNSSANGTNWNDWSGSGLQGELTTGYEWPRTSNLRVLLQADVTLPFYNVASNTVTYSRTGLTVTTDHRYAPALAVSLGLGWRGNRHIRRWWSGVAPTRGDR